MDVVILVAAVATMILLHELGHFLASKFFGIEVEEFGLGFPPKIRTLFFWKGTEFSLNWIPLGGFVRPKGENDPEVEGGLGKAPPSHRFWVYFAGPLMNLLIAALLYAMSFSHTGLPDPSQVVIQSVAPGSPAAQAGLRSGDRLLRIGGKPVTSMENVHALVSPHLGETLEITVLREGEERTFQVLARREPPPGEGALGIVMTIPIQPVSLLRALPCGALQVGNQTYMLLTLPMQVHRGLVAPEDARLVGYKGMYDMYKAIQEAETTQQAPLGVNTLFFFATISTSLGVLNLLPIPAMDGGRILFLLPEFIFHHRIPPKAETIINSISFALLLILLLYINLQDFINPASFSFK